MSDGVVIQQGYRASAVRHQKFQGMDIVTVEVEGSGS